MPSRQSPFVTKAIACPVCYTKTEHRFFRRRIFTIEETEPDQHVTRYKWTSDTVERVNPLYYAIYFCPECFYADVAEEFSKPYETESGAATVKAFKQTASDNTLVSLIGQHIDYEDIDFDAALRLHFLAVAVHSLPAVEPQDPYKLGRLYLRIGWLYREREQGLPEGIDADSAADDASAHDAGCAPQLLAAAEAFQESCSQLGNQWEDLEHLARQRAQELAQGDSESDNPYPPHVEALTSAWNALNAGLHELRDAAFRDASALLPETGEDSGETAQSSRASARQERRAQFLPRATFMERLQSLWESVPRNESDALALALEGFLRALTDDVRFDNPQSRLKISSLVIELQIRMGDYEGALEVTRQLHRLATTTRQKLQARLREDDVTESEFRRLSGMIHKANVTLESTAELRQSALQRIVAAEIPRIRKVFAGLPPKARIEDFEHALAANGVAKEIITYLKRRNMQLPAV